MEDSTTRFGQTQKGADPDAPIRKAEDSGVDVDFDDESDIPNKSNRGRSFTENVKTVNPQSVKASNTNSNQDHHLPSFAANTKQGEEIEMSASRNTAALDHSAIGL